jgi:ATP-dependent helicase HrpB
MSATLDADAALSVLPNAKFVQAEGRMFPVETRHIGEIPMERAVVRALKETDGDILCFLPGEGEIRRTMEALDGIDAKVLPLFGALPKEVQDQVFKPVQKRKVILATSIAETSLTIPGIKCVIDSGLMRIARFSSATGMSSLVTLPLSLDRAEQRRGRAGRVSSGICYRLWEESAERFRPEHIQPEILDADLTSVVLSCAKWGSVDRLDLPWIMPPPQSAWEQARQVLEMLGALDEGGRITDKGEKMASLPMHPRLANMIIAGGRKNLEMSSVLAAILEESSSGRETDIRKVFDAVRGNAHDKHSRRILQLSERFSSISRDVLTPIGEELDEGSLLAFAYPERIAKGRGNGTFRMVCGKGAALESDDALARKPYLVCCRLDDRPGDARIFLTCPIDEASVEEIFKEKIKESFSCEWDKKSESVKCLLRRTLGEMVISEKPSSNCDGSLVTSALIKGIASKGVENLPCWTKHAIQLKERIEFLRRVDKSAASPWPETTDTAILAALENFVFGIQKWKDLEKVDLCRVMDWMLTESGHDRRELDVLAPETLTVPSSSRIKINYSGAEPMLEVKLQECFGMMASPKIVNGKIPVVMTLLSPAMRPVQVTKDLAGFWKEGYAYVLKEMKGRYPKHYWPEDPFTATPVRRTVKANSAAERVLS